MANALYPLWKQNILQATTIYGLNSTNVRVAFVDTGVYTFSSAHQFYSSLSGGVFPNTRATGVALASKTYNTPSAGTFDAADVTFSAFSNGSVSVEAIVIYVDDGSADATSPLVLFLDTSITGMPFTPSGADVTIQWNASGIFSL
jgi:hypothetical protein